MNALDLINKVAISNNLTSGRAEMIISILMEKISDWLKKDGEVTIENFGTFNIQSKKISSSVFGESGGETKKYVVFTPHKKFLDYLNT
jgi:nucleoid DNA-binding protein